MFGGSQIGTGVPLSPGACEESPVNEIPDYGAIKAANRQLNSDEARRGVTRLKSRPLFFWFDLYGPCNLKCVHCGFNKDGRTSDKEVSEEIYGEVIREIMPTALTCNLGGTNWGEMTISKNFQRFLRDCRTYGVRVNLTTNGTRMNDSWLGDLTEVLDVAGFSMEGMEAEFEKIRGFPWRRFVENIEKLIQARRDQGKSFRVEWRYCAHSDSIHQLPDMIRTAKTIGIDRIQVMPLVPYVQHQQFKNLAYHRSLANEYFAKARAIARELDFNIRIPNDYTTGDFVPVTVQINGKDKTPAGPVATSDLEMVNCFRPWQSTAINELGNVKPCCVYWRSMGTLEHGFESVWNGNRYRALRASINTKSDSICHDCRMPAFGDSGRVAAELKPSLKQLAKQYVNASLHPPRVRFNGVLDRDFDPRLASKA